MSSKEPGGRRLDVLRVSKAAAAPWGIAEIADQLGVHANTIGFHLDTLVSERRADYMESDRREPGRPPLMFRAVRQLDRSGPQRYQLLAEILTTGFAADREPGAKALAAGRAWGQRLKLAAAPGRVVGAEESIEHLVGLLDRLGFAPERRESGGKKQIGLRHCPSLNSLKRGPPWSARSTWGSCKEHWKPGMRCSRSIGWTRLSNPTCAWPTSPLKGAVT